MIRIGLVFLVSLACTSVWAHSLSIFVRDEGGAFKGRVYFTGGDPAARVTVSVSGADGTVLGETTTDDAGNFEYTGPRPMGTAIFVSQTPDGHRAEAELRNVGPADESSTPRLVPSGVTTTMSRDAELTELHAAIDRLEHRLWLRDIIGGLGYIFGLAGLWALWKARSGGGARH